MLAQPGLPPECLEVTPDVVALPVIPTEFRWRGHRLRTFNVVTALGTPQDVALQDLRIEWTVPADTEAEQFLRAQALPATALA